MRSLWRVIAARWLGGHGSEALTRESALFELLMIGEAERSQTVFQVVRQTEVSHRAMMSPQDPDGVSAVRARVPAPPDDATDE